jgi:hypothetical protein
MFQFCSITKRYLHLPAPPRQALAANRKTHINHYLPAGSLGDKVLHFGDGFRR